MPCDYNRTMIDAFALSLLADHDKKTVGKHLNECLPCKELVLELRRALHLLEHSFNDEPPEWLIDKTITAVINHKRNLFKIWFWIVTPAIMVTLIVIAVLLYQPGAGIGRNHFKTNAALPAVSNAKHTTPPSTQRATSKPQATTGMVYYTGDTDEATDTFNPNSNTSQRGYGSQPIGGLFFKNPVADRTLYLHLGISNDIADLLL